jgi:hypothetical protein
LGENETSGTSTEHEHRRSKLGGDLVKSVSSAGSWLEESGVNIGKVVNLEDLASGLQKLAIDCWMERKIVAYVGAELSETTIHCHTVGLEVLAEQKLTTSAVEALIA